MARCINYRNRKPDQVRLIQEEISNATMYLLREFGPTSFLLQDDNRRKYRVDIGEEHKCTCTNFKTSSELCIHLVWILLKRFKIDENNPICWQLGLVEREVQDLLDGKFSRRTPVRTSNLEKDKLSESVNKSVQTKQRKIDPEDVCSICQDELLSEQRYPVTFCRKGCGNNVHIRCMRVWTDHQRKQNTYSLSDYIPCPLCRGEFAPLGVLLRELSEDVKSVLTKENKMAQSLQQAPTTMQPMRPHHPLTKCLACQCNPIFGNLYRCETCIKEAVDEDATYLCSKCFKSNEHSEHKIFTYRENPQKKWTRVPENRGVPHNLKHTLEPKFAFKGAKDGKVNWDQFFGQTEVLQSTSLSLLPRWTVRPPRPTVTSSGDKTQAKQQERNLKSEMDTTVGLNARLEHWGPVKTSGLLAPGRQCRVCLMSFQVGDEVRRMSPGCQHIFHAACIDPWLLHRSATCPIDGVPVAPAITHTTSANAGGDSTKNGNPKTCCLEGVSICNSAHAVQTLQPRPKKPLASANELQRKTDIKVHNEPEKSLSIVGQTMLAYANAHPTVGTRSTKPFPRTLTGSSAPHPTYSRHTSNKSD